MTDLSNPPQSVLSPIGQPIKRREDARFLTGAGQYTDDVVMQRQIVEQITDLRERLGFSVIFITHDVSLLIEIADRIAIMYAGEIVEEASADDVYRRPRHPYARGLLRSFPALHGPRRELGGISGSPPDLMALPSGCPFHPRCPAAVARCAVDHPELGPTAFGADEPGRRLDRLAVEIEHALDAGRRVACLLHDDVEGLPSELAVRAAQ